MGYQMMSDDVAYISCSEGYMKLNNIITMEINYEVFIHESMMLCGDRMAQEIVEQTITIKSTDVEMVEDIPFTKLSNFSNIELLEELEKRTKSNT